MMASSSGFAALTYPDRFLLRVSCSASSRGFPDIAAQAANFKNIVGGKSLFATGTSCSAPVRLLFLQVLPLFVHPLPPGSLPRTQVVAGIIALLNDFRLSQNMGTLGFINPWLYGHGMWGLNDITSGWNPGCGTGGFPTASGWDPVRSTRCLHFKCWLTLSSIGHRSRDP